MRPSDKIKRLIQETNYAADPVKRKQILSDASQALQQSRQEKPALWSNRMNKTILKIAVAAIILIAAGIIMVNKTGSLDGASIAWADVVERFHSVNYFNAVLYHKKDAQSQPEQVEIWIGKGGKTRIHINGQIVFCADGHIQKAFDSKTGKEAEPTLQAQGLFDTLIRNLNGFSLETFLKWASGGQLVNVTATINEDSLISNDLVIFDVEHQDSPKWFRIWALRNSKLPLHIRMLDSRYGACDDVIFDYSREPENSFFDPVAFSEKVKSVHNNNSIPYLLWEDRTGKSMTPKTPEEVNVFDFQFRTMDGRPWSFADHRGKTVLIKFWYGSDNALRTFSDAVEKQFGQRDDFLMVVIALRHPEQARDYFKNEPKWIVLQDTDKNIETIFGSISEQSVYILDKYGRLRKPANVGTERHGIAAVDEALNGLVYDSYYTGLISGRIMGWSEETIIQQYGKPDSVETASQSDVWNYRRYNSAKTEYFDVSVIFNQNKCVANITCSHCIVDPAIVKLRISERWWQKEVVAKLDPGLLSKPNAVFTVSFDQGNTSYPLGGDAYGVKPVSFKTETPYSRNMVPGKYDLQIELRETHSPYKLLWSQILIKDCELSNNQEKEITF